MPLEPHPTDPDKMVYKKPDYNFGWLQTEDMEDLEERYKLQKQKDEKRFDRLEKIIISLPILIVTFTFLNIIMVLYWMTK